METSPHGTTLSALAVRKAAEDLAALCTRYGESPAEPGANARQIPQIRAAFADLGFPLPDDLIEVYKATLFLKGLVNDQPILVAPCEFTATDPGSVEYLIEQEDDVEDLGVLVLGTGNHGHLFIDQGGACGVDPEQRPDGTYFSVKPMSFAEAFVEFARRQSADIKAEFEES